MYKKVPMLDRLLEPLLNKESIATNQIEVVTTNEGEDELKRTSTHSNLVGHYDMDALLGELTERGLPADDARFFSNGVMQGNTLVMLRVEDDRAAAIEDYLKHPESISSQDTSSAAMQSPHADKPASIVKAGASIAVVEEELHVQKQVVETGGVAVKRHVTSQRVEEDVSLREEHVSVQRTPVDRPASSDELLNAFSEGVVEVREHKEEVFVEKIPRVVEEVVITKDVEQTTAHINETLRRLDVDIEKIESRYDDSMRFDSMRDTYRAHFDQNYATSGADYSEYENAYRYGHMHALRDDWRDFSFTRASSTMTPDYEQRYGKGMWERTKDAIEHAWDSVRARF